MNKSWVANGVTALNAFFGGLSIMMSISAHYQLAAWCILAATVADAMDGRVARALGTAGPMGVELDSMSDDISFGVAAGALIYSYQLNELGFVGAIACGILGTCCAFRLARFNVRVSDVHGYFEGMPSPMTGMVISSYVLSGLKLPSALMLICVLLLAFLMVSEIHYPDNKGASADQLHLPVFLGCLAFLVICTILYWPAWAFALCLAYVVFGMLNTYMNHRKKLRKRKRLNRPSDED